jgi:hypothetical protein
MIDPNLSSFERAVDYVEKAEEYYEMAFQEATKGGWTADEKLKFIKILIKTLDQHSRLDSLNRV